MAWLRSGMFYELVEAEPFFTPERTRWLLQPGALLLYRGLRNVSWRSDGELWADFILFDEEMREQLPHVCTYTAPVSAFKEITPLCLLAKQAR